MIELQFEDIEEAVNKVDAHFEKLITLHSPMHDMWNDYIDMGLNGENSGRISNLVQNYVKLSNPVYPTVWRQTSATMTSWLANGEWLHIAPKDSDVLDTSLADALKQAIKQKYRDPNSNANHSFNAVDLQARLLNVSPVNYCYVIKTEAARNMSVENMDGRLRMRRSDGPEQIVYQGPRLETMPMHNVYPDILSPKANNLNCCDLYIKEPANFNQLKDSPKYDAEQPYPFQDFVIYRNNKKLYEIENPVYHPGDALKKLDQKVNKTPTQKDAKGFVELRRVYLEEFCVYCNGRKLIYDNVCLIYAKCDSKIVPLLIEYNYRPFNLKNVRLFQPETNPWGPYAKSQLGLSYNQSCWLNFVRAAQAYKIGKTTFKTRFIPGQLYAAAMKYSGVGQDDIEQGLRGAGYDIPYDADEYSLGANGIWTPDDKYEQKDISLYDQEIARLTNDLNQLNRDLQNTDVADSTAKGVEFVQQKQNALHKQYIRQFADQVLEPIATMTIQDLCNFIRDEVIEVDVDEDRFAEINEDLEHLKKIVRMTGENLAQEKVLRVTNGMPEVMGTSLNPFLMKEYIKLTSYLLQTMAFKAEIKVEGNDYDREDRKRDNLELLNFLQQMGAGDEASKQAQLLGMEEYLSLRPESDFNKKYKQVLQASKEESEMQKQQKMMEMQQMQAQAQAQMQQAQADTHLKAATAEEKIAKAEESHANAAEEKSRADKQNLENMVTAQMVGV